MPFTAGDDITELQVLLEPQVAGAPTNMNSEVIAVVEPKKLLLGKRMRSCMLNQDRPVGNVGAAVLGIAVVGVKVGTEVGANVGTSVGCVVGAAVGIAVGPAVG